jgi:hypothetical protein
MVWVLHEQYQQRRSQNGIWTIDRQPRAGLQGLEPGIVLGSSDPV